MKCAIAALGMLASVASAYEYSPPPHKHANNTAPAGQTTLTVIATQVKTITSCAATVTNCPAEKSEIASLPESQRATVVVTDTIVLSTTVCPVAEASSISASIISKASSSQLPGATSAPWIRTTAIRPGAPLTTGGPGAVTSKADGGSLPPGMTTTTTDVVTSKTLTMTMGTGTEASVVTSTIRSTIKKTITVPCSQTDSGNSPATTGPAGNGTTTTTATSKVTRTVTVSKAGATKTPGVAPTGIAPTGVAPSGGNCQCPAITAPTVTVTAAASTVYVTVGSSVTRTGKQPTVTDKGGDDDDDDDDDCTESTTIMKATVTVVPYPSGNGTHATSGRASPSGFSRLRR